MPADPNTILEAVHACFPDAQDFLERLITIPSLSGQEDEALAVAQEWFERIAPVERIPMSDALRDDKDYSDPIPDIHYEGRSNLRTVLSGKGRGKNLLLSTHIDIVPPSQGQTTPFQPDISNGKMFGRGSCDAKGQIATILLTMMAVRELGLDLKGNLIGHVVVEEENGGNGTLAMVRHGETADGCVVLEPTEHRILSSIRGPAWFRITVRGKAGHSGTVGKTQSALKMAIRVIEILEQFHADLLAESRGDPLFDRHTNPMPLTIGQLHAGNWPATAPGEASLAGVLGFLPNKDSQAVMDGMMQAIRTQGGSDIANNLSIDFTYRHDASVVPVDCVLVKELETAVAKAGQPPQVDAMTASCDAWFYNNQLGIPTVVFGGGSLSTAHSIHECMPLDSMEKAAHILTHLALNWCR